MIRCLNRVMVLCWRGDVARPPSQSANLGKGPRCVLLAHHNLQQLLPNIEVFIQLRNRDVLLEDSNLILQLLDQDPIESHEVFIRHVMLIVQEIRV
jgi:hypothetical protein